MEPMMMSEKVRELLAEATDLARKGQGESALALAKVAEIIQSAEMAAAQQKAANEIMERFGGRDEDLGGGGLF